VDTQFGRKPVTELRRCPMKEARRRFSREFKLEAVRQLEAGSRLADLARALGVNATVLRRWQGQVKVDPATSSPGNGRVAREEDELQRLRKEVVQLRAERDFLKKVAVCAARRLAERVLRVAPAPPQRPGPAEHRPAAVRCRGVEGRVEDVTLRASRRCERPA
jgi:transposase